MILNMGPQHPSTHGVLRVILEIDGETVVRIMPDIGYLHTGLRRRARLSSINRWCRLPTASTTSAR
jgi:NADH:ubiquinone oxidoreductase subunit D